MTTCPVIETLKSKYPRPVAYDMTEEAHSGFGRCYCVGGALLRNKLPLYKRIIGAITSYPRQANFPDHIRLAAVLKAYNPKLDGTAYEFSTKIIRQNDDGSFDGAWDTACKALTWTPDTVETPEEEVTNG